MCGRRSLGSPHMADEHDQALASGDAGIEQVVLGQDRNDDGWIRNPETCGLWSRRRASPRRVRLASIAWRSIPVR